MGAGYTLKEQTGDIARNLMGWFEGVEVEKWRFGVTDWTRDDSFSRRHRNHFLRPRHGRWMLFDWEGEEGQEKLVQKECVEDLSLIGK